MVITVSSSLHRALRKLDPQAHCSDCCRSVMLAGAGRTARSSVCSGAYPHVGRRTGANEGGGCPSNSFLRRTNAQQERRCINELESTGSPVSLQACYKDPLTSRPANTLQFEGKSAKV